ncbi:hypothetical protein [Perlabentimonas gracilis]|uniref:hypothetical protein n=1 Tax=Perlabentimonas gracilis TaxID=2715279 RepID=UPI001409E6F4|nr:hypothetical protein [Perlabentimonas gracilis]NHB70391.1 hypothetical protein [Perlabentimonas gracilis]
MNFITKLFKWLVYLLLLVISLYLIDLLLGWLIMKALTISTFWLIVLAIFFSSIIIGLFSSFCSILIGLLMTIPPNKKIAGIIFSLFAFIIGIGDFIAYLKLDTSILAKIIILIQVIIVWGSLTYLGMNRDLFEES